jgi:hypothetical protein
MVYTESDFAIEFFGLLLTIAWCYTVGGWIWRLLPDKWERNDAKFLIMFFIFLPASTLLVMAIAFAVSFFLIALGLQNRDAMTFLNGTITSIICISIMWWTNEQNKPAEDTSDALTAFETDVAQSGQQSQTKSAYQPVIADNRVGNLNATNFASTISSIAMNLKLLFLSEMIANKNALPPCLLNDDYILGFCWAASIKQAKQENLETFNLKTDVKWEILIRSISKAIAVDPNVLGPKLRTAVKNKTDMFSSGYSDGSEYDWSSPSKAGDNFEDRKRALLES